MSAEPGGVSAPMGMIPRASQLGQHPYGDIRKCYVHIIESPAPADLLDGRTEGSALVQSLHLANIPAEYHLAVDRQRFEECLNERIVQKIQSSGLVPIIHFSGHGNKEGIELTDRTSFRWEELDDLLRPIHSASEGQTMVCLSSCEAARGIEMARPAERNFFALVGSTEDVYWDDAAVGFIAFYHRLFKGATIAEAVAAMRAASGHESFRADLGATAALKKWLGSRSLAELFMPQAGPLLSSAEPIRKPALDPNRQFGTRPAQAGSDE